MLTNGTILEGCLPDVDKVISMLKDKIKILDQSPKSTTAAQKPTPPPTSKKPRSMFVLVEEVEASSQSSSSSQSDNEVQDYLILNRVDSTLSPLEYWKKNETKFPLLSKLAAKYLSFPATSGSVERLFSIAGAIGRARRSRLSLENIEKILCCRDALLQLIGRPRSSVE